MNYNKYILLYLFFSYIFMPLISMEEKRYHRNQPREIFFINNTGLQLNVIFNNSKFPISGFKVPLPKEANIPAEILLKPNEFRPFYQISNQIRFPSSYGLTLSEKSELQQISLKKVCTPKPHPDRFGNLKCMIQDFSRAEKFHINTNSSENPQKSEQVPINYGATYCINFNEENLEVTMIQE